MPSCAYLFCHYLSCFTVGTLAVVFGEELSAQLRLCILVVHLVRLGNKLDFGKERERCGSCSHCYVRLKIVSQ